MKNHSVTPLEKLIGYLRRNIKNYYKIFLFQLKMTSFETYHQELESKAKDIIESRNEENWEDWKINNKLKKKRKDIPTKSPLTKEIQEELLLDAFLNSKDGELPYYFICKVLKHYNGVRATHTHQCRFCDGTLQLYCVNCTKTGLGFRV